MAAAPGVASPLRRPRRKGEITAERILDAAEALFAEHGYAGTTLRDVAERVGIRIPSLYNHFESKDALYAAVLERGVGPVLAMLSELVASGRDAAREAHAIVSRVMGQLAKRPALPRLLLHETLSGGQRLTPALRDWIAPTFLISLLGLPAASVPAGLTSAGLPVGLQIVGRRFADGEVLGAARLVQELRPIGIARECAPPAAADERH